MADGHRGRVRSRFEEENIDTIPEAHVLERIIHNVIIRKDAGEVSRKLIAEFGSLAKVIDAPKSELLKIDGIGPAAATFLKTIPAFYRKYQLSKWNDRKVFSDADTIIKYLQDKLVGYSNEVFAVMCLDSTLRLIVCKTISDGSPDSASVSIRKILDIAMNSNAARVVVAHNHPAGSLDPSTEDINATKRIYNALNYAGIQLDDHIITNDDDAVSLVRLGKFPTEPSVI